MDRRDKINSVLSESSQYVKGVGPSRQVLLSRLGIETVGDLVTHFPRSYYDRSDLVRVGSLKPGEQSGFTATVLAVSLRRIGPRRTILTVAAGDESGIVNLVFFNQPYLERYFRQGARIVASGTAGVYRGQKQIVSPEYEIVSGDLTDELLHAGRIVPVYPLTAGISQRMMRRIVKAAIDKCAGSIVENLPSGLLSAIDIPGRDKALSDIHYPSDFEALRRAVRRFKFEEVFLSG